MPMRRLSLACLLASLFMAGAAPGGAWGAAAAGTRDCGVYRLPAADVIDGHPIAKGTYRLSAKVVSCQVVAGRYGLFDQFVAQEASTTLPLPWRYSYSAGKRKFSAGRRAYFTASKVRSRVGARATQGPQNKPCAPVKVSADQTIDGRIFVKGTYQVNAFGISCAKVVSRYGLFDQFLTQDDSRALPKPWASLIAVGQPKFVAKDGVGFRAQRISQ